MHSEKPAVVRTERLVIASPLQSHGEGTFPVPNHPSQAWTFMLLKSTPTHPRPITSSPLLARACPSQSAPIRICLLNSSLLAQRSRPCCQVSLCQAMFCRQGWNYLSRFGRLIRSLPGTCHSAPSFLARVVHFVIYPCCDQLKPSLPPPQCHARRTARVAI